MENALIERVVMDAMGLRNIEICRTIRRHMDIVNGGDENTSISGFRIFISVTKGDLSKFLDDENPWFVWMFCQFYRKET